MSPKIIHFDIRPWKGKDIDLARMFPMTEAHPVRNMSVRFFVDDIRKNRMTLDLWLPNRIELVRFRTIPTLDLALREIVDPKPWQQKILWLAPRPHTINLMSPLDTPYEAIDLRVLDRVTSSKKTPRDENWNRVLTKSYPDLYTRRLPYSLMMQRTSKEVRHWTKSHRKWIISVVLTLFLTTIPVLLFVRYSVLNGYEKLLSLKDQSQMVDVISIVNSARDDFERANFLFLPFSWIPSDTVDLASRAIQWWRLLTRWIWDILKTLPDNSQSEYSIDKSDVLSYEYRWVSRDIFPLESIGIDTPTDWLNDNSMVVESAFSDLSRAGYLYGDVATGSELSSKMHDVWVLLSRGMRYFTYASSHKDELLQFLGHEEPIRYLVFNQNRDEIRANGWFPGSVIVFTLYKGNILDLRRDDVYYYDWNLYPYKEQPPPGLALLTENYWLRDVNYYPDFRLTLDKANAFIERSGDSTITSGIAIHQWLIEELLEKTWPVSVSGVTIPFDSSNFSLLMSTLVENQFAREHNPKDILFLFADSLILKIHEKRLYESVFDVFEDYWNNGEILFASRDESMDNIIAEFRKELPWQCETVINEQWIVSTVGISSENTPSSYAPPSCSPNWIYPIFTSVSGNKSDRYITRKYQAKTTKIVGCTYENKITISLSHIYSKNDTQKIKSYMDTLWITEKSEREKLEFIEWDGKNRSFTRLYVPRNSTLAFTGSDITTTENEHAKVFSFMLETPVWWSTSKTIRYTVDIPNCNTDSTSLSWTRQPGIRELIIDSDE